MLKAALVTLLSIPTIVHAGAWPRAEGETYALIQGTTGDDDWLSLYAERGTSAALTFGIAVGGRSNLITEWDRDARIRVFARRAVPLPWDSWAMSVETGVGLDVRTGRDVDAPLPRTMTRGSVGVSVGRGFATAWGGGWTNLDLRHDRPLEDPDPARHHDFDEARDSLAWTVGLKPAPKIALEMNVHAERGMDHTAYAIGPTWQRTFDRLGDGRIGIAWQDDGDAHLTIGLSRVFGGR